MLGACLALWLIALLATHDARERVAGVSSAVRDNLEFALADTLGVAYQDRALVGAPCHSVARQLQEQGAYTAYVRDVVLVSRGMRYCSAVRGEIAVPLSELLNWQPGLQYRLARPYRRQQHGPGGVLWYCSRQRRAGLGGRTLPGRHGAFGRQAGVSRYRDRSGGHALHAQRR
ncbi:CSS-motif domain-containing protein [Cupriavidus basilensis]